MPLTEPLRIIVDNIKQLRDRNDPGLIQYLVKLNKSLSPHELNLVKRELLSS